MQEYPARDLDFACRTATRSVGFLHHWHSVWILCSLQVPFNSKQAPPLEKRIRYSYPGQRQACR